MQPVPADTGAVTPGPVDTAAVAVPPQDTVPADTGASVPQQKVAPADTGAIPAQPADTGIAAPQEKITPAEPGTVSPPPQSIPEDTAKISSPEEEGAKEKPAYRFGLGIVFNDEAPLSIRAWLNPKVGLDIGVGLKARRVDDTVSITDSTPTAASRVTMLDLNFDLGIPVRVFRTEKVDFLVRPGFGFRTRPGFFTTTREGSTVQSIETSLELEVNGSVGIEYYPSERLSFGLVSGFALVAERTGGTGNTNLRLESLPSRKGVNYSFRYYIF